MTEKPTRRRSWAATLEEAEERQSVVRRLVGASIASVRYFDIDYRSYELVGDIKRPRVIDSEQEWAEPTWRFMDCDGTDYGLELDTVDGRTFSVTWDPPSRHEGLGIEECPLAGSAFTPDATYAVWDVSRRSSWMGLLGVPITHAEMNYRPWAPDDGFWCSRISLAIGPKTVEILLGEGSPNKPVAPSADNVAVLFDPEALPDWEIR